MTTKKYFGTDGVRGEVGNSIITPEFVMRLGNAAGRVLISKDQAYRPTVLIGKDTRISGYMLEAALEAGFAAAGVNVLLTGPLPTPGIAYLTRALRLDAGVMISASHNVFKDNGIKFFAQGGVKLNDDVELEIEQMLEQEMVIVGSAEFGRAKRITGAVDRYIEFCKSTFPNSMNLRGLKIVIDTAHGAAYHVAPKVFHELGAEVISIGNEPNGFNINDKVGATYTKTIQAAVLQNDADYGVSLDGDGDRLMMVDRSGRVYDGDSLIYVIAKARHQSGQLQGGVVGTVMTNMGMEIALKDQGIAFERSQVGDRYVLEKLLNNNWQIGGEASGHILCMDKHNTGDGIVSALQVFASLQYLDKDLSTVLQDWQAYPQVLLNIPYDKKSAWQDLSKSALAEAELALADGLGRVVLRASGTEPVVRIMVEAAKLEMAQSYAAKIAQSISANG